MRSTFKAVLSAFAAASLVLAVPLAAEPVPPGSTDEIRARLAPFGSICRAGEDCGQATAVAAGGGAKSGEDVYSQFCFACHATGASGAPLFADSEAWAPRIAKGMETLMASTLNGLGLMPPRGTCMSCSDEELSAAVDYMLAEVQ